MPDSADNTFQMLSHQILTSKYLPLKLVTISIISNHKENRYREELGSLSTVHILQLSGSRTESDADSKMSILYSASLSLSPLLETICQVLHRKPGFSKIANVCKAGDIVNTFISFLVRGV